jgi:replicative DNA helicase
MLSVVKLEQAVINCIWDEPDLIYKFDKPYFQSRIAQDLFNTLKALYEDQVPFLINNIIAEGNKHNDRISREFLEKLRSEEYSVESFETYYFPQLRKEYAKVQIRDKLLQDTLIETSSKEDFDVEKVNEFVIDLQENLDIIRGKESTLMSATQMALRYEEALQKRARGEHKYSFGDSFLDRFLTVGAAPGQITTIFGATGVGKSTYALNLVNRQINKHIPSLYISLEMDTISTMDRLIAIRQGVPVSLFYPNEEDDIPEEAFQFFREESNKLSKSKRFYFIEDPTVSLSDLEFLIQEAKRKMGVSYLICTVDLLTMISDIGGNPSEIEESMNRVHRIAKRNNVHIVGVLQANRSADSHSVPSIDQIDRLRPTLNNVKNSHAFAERSRILLSVFRPYYYARRYFPDAPELETMEDVLEIGILKQSQGQTGHILKYLYDGEKFSIYPFLNNEEEI